MHKSAIKDWSLLMFGSGMEAITTFHYKNSYLIHVTVIDLISHQNRNKKITYFIANFLGGTKAII